jgi:hypothetical protein
MSECPNSSTIAVTNVLVTYGTDGTITATIQGAPTNTQAPVIGGTAVVGDTLSMTNSGTWSGSPTPTYTYQWQRCTNQNGTGCTNIQDATSSSYTLANADVGKYVLLTVTGTNTLDSTDANSNTSGQVTVAVPNSAPMNGLAPQIAGTAVVGDALTVTSNGIWSASPTPTYTYQWQRCTGQNGTGCTTIQGATSGSYTLATADVGEYVLVTVKATNAAGSANANSGTSAQVSAPTPTPTPSPTQPSVGQIRSALNGLTHPSGMKAITALLKTKIFKTAFRAPSAGRITIVWETTVTVGTGKNKRHAVVTIATGTSYTNHSGKLMETVHLKAAGKSLLKQKSRGLSTKAIEKFQPTGGKATSITKTFKL